MAYCSQEPWPENGKIRQTIVATDALDEKWYNAVKFACGLVTDIKQLQKGDDTRIGSKGLNLSGGQKQRLVNITPDLVNILRIILIFPSCVGFGANCLCEAGNCRP